MQVLHVFCCTQGLEEPVLLHTFPITLSFSFVLHEEGAHMLLSLIRQSASSSFPVSPSWNLHRGYLCNVYLLGGGLPFQLQQYWVPTHRFCCCYVEGISPLLFHELFKCYFNLFFHPGGPMCLLFLVCNWNLAYNDGESLHIDEHLQGAPLLWLPWWLPLVVSRNLWLPPCPIPFIFLTQSTASGLPTYTSLASCNKCPLCSTSGPDLQCYQSTLNIVIYPFFLRVFTTRSLYAMLW